MESPTFKEATRVNRLLNAVEEMSLLSDAEKSDLIEGLKDHADDYWGRDPHISLLFANVIIGLGEARGIASDVALGTMARGDALRFLHRFRQAWDTLAQAGALFLGAGDAVGWARTRIGRLLASLELEDVDVDVAYADAKRAETILIEHQIWGRLVSLYLNLGTFHVKRHEYVQALGFFEATFPYFKEVGAPLQAKVWYSLGHTQQALGNFTEAESSLAHALVLAERLNQPHLLTTVRLNRAILYQEQGQYWRALALLHLIETDSEPMHVALAHANMSVCYRMLGNYRDARDWAAQSVEELKGLDAVNDMGRALVLLIEAEIGLRNYEAAKKALNEAESIHGSRKAVMLLIADLISRGVIALRQKDTLILKQTIQELNSISMNQAGSLYLAFSTNLLVGESALLEDGTRTPQAAYDAGKSVLRLARQSGMPSLRYQAHFLMGRAREGQGRVASALRHYAVAAGVVERLQRDMQITFRPGFLEDREGALRGIIRLHLEAEHHADAFSALERMKSQVLFGYLLNSHGLRWPTSHPEVAPLIEALEKSRARYRWLLSRHDQLQVAEPSPADTAIADDEKAERQQLERDMRHITERLYLLADHVEQVADAPSLEHIVGRIPESGALIEYFTDEDQLWAFVLNSTGRLIAQRLPATVATILDLARQMRQHINRALAVGPRDFSIPRHRGRAIVALQKLYDVLLRPLESLITRRRERLIIVPYGCLHGLPFHLLHDGHEHLGLQHEVVIHPAAGLLARLPVRRAPGALMLTYSDPTTPLQTEAEVNVLRDCFEATVHKGSNAVRSRLNAPPTQILHVAAHGKHRLEQPQFSNLVLADGPIYADDLLQYDLGYELVTLSACETGLCRASGGDELIGLGRGFLYAGAGALLTSLWRVEDRFTASFMQAFYAELHNGATKAAALCHAQRALRDRQPDLHPAFWGAFQLMGSAEPLSHYSIV